MSVEQVSVRPFARLLTMLGEQLIKNDRVALVELIKNSYDADAENVRVNFIDFDEPLSTSSSSAIRISDDGAGMTEEVVRNQWMNPATPGKLISKLAKPYTQKNRVMQGEKGIGRYAIFKLGRRAQIVSRAINSPTEFVITYDISMLDEELLASDDAPEKVAAASIYLDELPVTLETRTPKTFANGSGTQITITDLRGTWSETDYEAAFKDVVRLTPLKWGEASTEISTDKFVVDFQRNGKSKNPSSEFLSDVDRLISERAVLRVEHGRFDPVGRRFAFELNKEPISLSVDSTSIRGKKAFKDRFVGKGKPETPDFACGPFDFAFYVFDFSSRAPAEFKVDTEERDSLRQHRIYLYRDGIRVLPYGDPDDDWLQIDVARGTQNAGRTFSNDQTLGYVLISRERNPDLRDKTSREGLIDTGRAIGDFIALIQSLLSYLRAEPYAKYVLDNHELAKRKAPTASLESRIANVTEVVGLPGVAKKELVALLKEYRAERSYLVARAERTEDLAGVGLSIEAASHDVIASANEALRTARRLKQGIGHLTGVPVHIRENSNTVVDRLDFVNARLQDIQGLFVSSRQKRANHYVPDFAARVASIYKGVLAEAGVEVEYAGDREKFHAVTTEAALLQMLINLFDNAIYWLVAGNSVTRRIRIRFDQSTRTMTFSDSGPGVSEDDKPYIFEPFFSGKGEEGKGLGLYIAREVGERSGFTIQLAGSAADLPGAAFEVVFAK